jgi:hypothetical protein
MSKDRSPVTWLDDVAEHDYDAAVKYLSLKVDHLATALIIERLRVSKVTTRRPNDILRAAGLPALPMSDPGVHRDLMKVLNGEKLSPVLVVNAGGSCEIADGYHRVSLCYNIDPFMDMPLRVT